MAGNPVYTHALSVAYLMQQSVDQREGRSGSGKGNYVKGMGHK